MSAFSPESTSGFALMVHCSLVREVLWREKRWGWKNSDLLTNNGSFMFDPKTEIMVPLLSVDKVILFASYFGDNF